jgi:hypothetical protein
MSDLHIDDFCKDAARILNQLYLVFPRKSTLFVEDIAGHDEPDEFGMHSERHMACFGTMVWLAEEGLIRYADTIRQEAVDQAILGGRAFALLSAVAEDLTEEEHAELELAPAPDGDAAASLPPSVLRTRRTHINRLRSALRSRSSERVRAVTLDLLARLRS